jgi:hypothetical protein
MASVIFILDRSGMASVLPLEITIAAEVSIVVDQSRSASVHPSRFRMSPIKRKNLLHGESPKSITASVLEY